MNTHIQDSDDWVDTYFIDDNTGVYWQRNQRNQPPDYCDDYKSYNYKPLQWFCLAVCGNTDNVYTPQWVYSWHNPAVNRKGYKLREITDDPKEMFLLKL